MMDYGIVCDSMLSVYFLLKLNIGYFYRWKYIYRWTHIGTFTVWTHSQQRKLRMDESFAGFDWGNCKLRRIKDMDVEAHWNSEF